MNQLYSYISIILKSHIDFNVKVLTCTPSYICFHLYKKHFQQISEVLIINILNIISQQTRSSALQHRPQCQRDKYSACEAYHKLNYAGCEHHCDKRKKYRIIQVKDQIVEMEIQESAVE